MWESRLELTPELSDRGSHIIPYAWGGLSHALAPNHLSRLSRIGPFCGCGHGASYLVAARGNAAER